METCALRQGSCQPSGRAARAQPQEVATAGWKFPRSQLGAPDAVPDCSLCPPARLTEGPGQLHRAALLLRGKDENAHVPYRPSSGLRVQPVTLQALVCAPAHVLAGVFPEETVPHPAA